VVLGHAEQPDVIDNDLDMLGLQVFDGLSKRVQEVCSSLRFHARRLEDDRRPGRDGMNDFCHGAAFVMTASGDRLTGSQVDDVACAGQKPIFDVSLRRPRSNGVFLPGRGIEIEAVGNDADLDAGAGQELAAEAAGLVQAHHLRDRAAR
jgi:hypothetical protein